MAEEVKRVSLLCAGNHNFWGFVIATALSLPKSMKREELTRLHLSQQKEN